MTPESSRESESLPRFLILSTSDCVRKFEASARVLLYTDYDIESMLAALLSRMGRRDTAKSGIEALGASLYRPDASDFQYAVNVFTILFTDVFEIIERSQLYGDSGDLLYEFEAMCGSDLVVRRKL